MKINVDEAVKKSGNLTIYVPFQDEFSKYSQMYFSTTEKVKDYFLNLSFGKDRALSVLASGDQVFNLIYSGVKEIDTFDINLLTYFNFYFKYAIMKTFSFLEWEKLNEKGFCFPSNQDFLDLLEQIKAYLPNDVYDYFYRLASIPTFDLTSLYTKNRVNFNKDSNLYASDEKSYNKTKKNLESTVLNFYFGDASEISSKFKGNYDIIILSNIWDYLGIEKPITKKELDIFLNSYKKLLKQRGILITYFYGLKKDYIIYNSLVKTEELTEGTLYPLTIHEGYYVIKA